MRPSKLGDSHGNVDVKWSAALSFAVIFIHRKDDFLIIPHRGAFPATTKLAQAFNSSDPIVSASIHASSDEQKFYCGRECMNNQFIVISLKYMTSRSSQTFRRCLFFRFPQFTRFSISL